MSEKVVFLGGTCNEDPWRDQLIAKLDHRIKVFNPVVPDWNKEAQERENEVKKSNRTIQLFVITSKMTGVFSVAEVVDASHKAPRRTIFCYKTEGFDDGQKKSLAAVGQLVWLNGVTLSTWEALPAAVKAMWQKT